MDIKNLKENGLSLHSSHDCTTAKHPKHIDDSYDCNEDDKTNDDNGFSTLSREECKKKVKKRRGRLRPALKHGKRYTERKEARGVAPAAQKSARRRSSRISCQKRGKEEEMGKSISSEFVSGTQSPSTSTSRITSKGKNLSKIYSTSSNNSSSSDLDPIDDSNRKKVFARICRKKQNELMDDLRICDTRYSDSSDDEQKPNKNVEKSKDISEGTANGTQSPIPSTSSITSEGRILSKINNTSPNNSSSCELDPELETRACHEGTLSTSSISSDSPETAELKKREKHRLREQEYRKTERELMEKLRILIPRLLNYPKASKAQILFFAKQYIEQLVQNVERNKKILANTKKAKKRLRRKIENFPN